MVYVVQHGAWNSKDEDDRVHVTECTTSKSVTDMYMEHVKKYKGRELGVNPVFSVWRGTKLCVKAKELVSKFVLANWDYSYDEEHNGYDLPDIILLDDDDEDEEE